MRKTKMLLAAAAILSLAAACNAKPQPVPQTYLDGIAVLAGQTLNIEIADTASKRERGLSGRDGIADDQGMLFLFDQPGQPNFWMKGMKFPIDIVWIADDKVVDITRDAKVQENAQKDQDYALYAPNTQITKVLELKSGWADRFGLKIGDKISLKIGPKNP